MYLTVAYSVHACTKGIPSPQKEFQVRTYDALPDAVAHLDHLLSSAPESERSILSQTVPEKNKWNGVPSLMLEVHESDKDVWMMWAPKSTPSKILFKKDENDSLFFDKAFSFRNVRRDTYKKDTINQTQTGYEVMLG